MGIFDQALLSLDDDPFEESPADLKDFLYKEEYLGLARQEVILSDEQELMVDLMSQVYRLKDLERLFGAKRAEVIWSHTKREIIMMLGKGAGKDFTSTIGCAYLVHKLLCLRDPQKYFGKPANNAIDIINIAVNAQQANNVFFKNFINVIEAAPWFVGKYTQKNGQMSFDKNVTVYSGHSERESWEGYNTILVILDEIAGFAMESSSGNENAKTAKAVYDMYAASVTSRFPDVGKIVELSFPRYEGDFITKRYADVIKEKEVVLRSETVKINPELPDGIAENEVVVEWEEDHIISYKEPNIFALKRPCWDINPTKKIEMYVGDFIRDPVQALSRFACMPPKAVDAFFKSVTSVESAFSNFDSALDEEGRLRSDFEPVAGTDYFVHVDLAEKHDHCAISMAHVSGWGLAEGGKRGVEPRITVDLVKYWKPSTDKPMDFDDVVSFIRDLARAGFHLKLITFDRWNSTQTIQDLRAYGLRAETLSVALQHYMDFLIALNEGRIDGPDNELLREEMLQLRIIKSNRVDHPRKGSKDLSDAVCGAVYNAAKHTPRSSNTEIEIFSARKPLNDEKNEIVIPEDGVVRVPKRKAPPEIEEFLARVRMI